MQDDQPEDPRIDTLVAAVTAAHAAHIPAEETARLRASVISLRAAVTALDAYPLTNADEPDTLFAAYRREG